MSQGGAIATSSIQLLSALLAAAPFADSVWLVLRTPAEGDGGRPSPRPSLACLSVEQIANLSKYVPKSIVSFLTA